MLILPATLDRYGTGPRGFFTIRLDGRQTMPTRTSGRSATLSRSARSHDNPNPFMLLMGAGKVPRPIRESGASRLPCLFAGSRSGVHRF